MIDLSTIEGLPVFFERDEARAVLARMLRVHDSLTANQLTTAIGKGCKADDAVGALLALEKAGVLKREYWITDARHKSRPIIRMSSAPKFPLRYRYMTRDGEQRKAMLNEEDARVEVYFNVT